MSLARKAEVVLAMAWEDIVLRDGDEIREYEVCPNMKQQMQ